MLHAWTLSLKASAHKIRLVGASRITLHGLVSLRLQDDTPPTSAALNCVDAR